MGPFKNITAASLLAAYTLAFTAAANAVDPFDNWPNPKGWYAVDYPAYYTANVFTDKNGHKSFNPEMRLARNVFRALWYTKSPLLPNTLVFSAIMPYDKLEMRLGSRSTASGLGDLTLLSGYFFSESPTAAFGLGVFVDIPTGAYDKTKTVNVGSDVWNFRPMLGYFRLIGQLDIETTLKYNIPSENSGSAAAGGAKGREGNKILFSSFTGCFINKKTLLGANFNYHTADASRIAGEISPGTGARVFQLGGSLNYMPSPVFNAMLQVMSDFNTRNAAEGTLYMGRLVWHFKGS